LFARYANQSLKVRQVLYFINVQPVVGIAVILRGVTQYIILRFSTYTPGTLADVVWILNVIVALLCIDNLGVDLILHIRLNPVGIVETL